MGLRTAAKAWRDDYEDDYISTDEEDESAHEYADGERPPAKRPRLYRSTLPTTPSPPPEMPTTSTATAGSAARIVHVFDLDETLIQFNAGHQ